MRGDDGGVVDAEGIALLTDCHYCLSFLGGKGYLPSCHLGLLGDVEELLGRTAGIGAFMSPHRLLLLLVDDGSGWNGLLVSEGVLGGMGLG